MPVFIASLNSGSNGNCYYIGNDEEAVLIDVGISCREVEKRMKRLSLDIGRIRAIFISHEHSDHIAGLRVLSNRYQIPVFITPDTVRMGRLSLRPELVSSFLPDEMIRVGNLRVTPFIKYHDACDPHSFIVSYNDIHVGVFTDIGQACPRVTHHFSQCHAAFLEANYDRDMLFSGDYPFHLKKRISGGEGHLSNDEALKLFLDHRPSHMSHLILSHLSKNNNDPERVDRLFQPHARHTEICIASRYAESRVFRIDTDGVPIRPLKKLVVPKPQQLKLF